MKCQIQVEFEDGSNLALERKDLYTNFDEMPKRIQRKLVSIATVCKFHLLVIC